MFLLPPLLTSILPYVSSYNWTALFLLLDECQRINFYISTICHEYSPLLVEFWNLFPSFLSWHDAKISSKRVAVSLNFPLEDTLHCVRIIGHALPYRMQGGFLRSSDPKSRLYYFFHKVYSMTFDWHLMKTSSIQKSLLNWEASPFFILFESPNFTAVSRQLFSKFYLAAHLSVVWTAVLGSWTQWNRKSSKTISWQP